MALFDLNRSNDTPIATLLLSDIVPKDWPTNPLPMPPVAPINVPVVAYTGGAVGDDVSVATANATLDYAPRTQAAKAAAMVPAGSLAVDVARARGAIGAKQPYPVAGDTPPAAPVIATLAPATAVSGAPAITVIINGTGYTQWSTVRSGGVPIPVKYLSPTQLQIVESAPVAGTVQVIVTDHNVDSAPSNFVFT